MSPFLARATLPFLLVPAACYVPAGSGYYSAPAQPGPYAAQRSYAPAPAPPPRQEYGYGAGRYRAPHKECRSEYGTTACGFHCEAAYGDVRCAETPMGACASAYGQVVCWDPEPAVVNAYGYQGRPAQCLAEYGDIACGYGCVAAYGEIRCAPTPEDVCQSSYGQIRCTGQ